MVSYSEIIIEDLLADYEAYGYGCRCDGDRKAVRYFSEETDHAL